MNVSYNKNEKNLLSQLSEKYGSDKGSTIPGASYNNLWTYHTYTDFYSIIFSHFRFSINSIFECGLGTNDESFKSNMTSNGTPGASLRMWKEYFPNASVYGADIDEKALFNEDRIQTYWLDQTSKKSIDELWNKVDVSFDIFIDDGLHEYDANITLYESSIHKVRSGGLYIIEDIVDADLPRYKSYFNNKDVYFESVVLSGPNTPIQNILLVIHV
jgi:hypothetical protein